MAGVNEPVRVASCAAYTGHEANSKPAPAKPASAAPGHFWAKMLGLRDGIWRTPSTPKGEWALPPVKMPRVRVS